MTYRSCFELEHHGVIYRCTFAPSRLIIMQEYFCILRYLIKFLLKICVSMLRTFIAVREQSLFMAGVGAEEKVLCSL